MLNVPTVHCDPDRDGTNSARAVIMDFKNQIGLVVGRADYCGALLGHSCRTLPAVDMLPLRQSVVGALCRKASIIWNLFGTLVESLNLHFGCSPGN
jgi:ATP-dependent phosphoenolpyruvate carboxykinase